MDCKIIKEIIFEAIDFKHAVEVIDRYLNGEISVIEELEPEILINEETCSATVPFLVSPAGEI